MKVLTGFLSHSVTQTVGSTAGFLNGLGWSGGAGASF